MKMSQLVEQLRRQETQARNLAEQQRQIVEVGGNRLDSLDERLAIIQLNTERIAELETRVAVLEAHAADIKLHTGKAK